MAPTEPESDYPESDGKPLADNTLQLDWIIKLVGNLRSPFYDRPDVFVAGNQFWYPVKRHPEIVQTPDVYVVYGRPKGHRGSYRQWEEGGVPMTVVFEVLSPENTPEETAGKVLFYERYGVEECYVFDPDTNELQAHVRGKDALVPTHPGREFVSPRLGIRFDRSGPEMVVRHPDGQPFLALEEVAQSHRAAGRRAEDARQRAENERRQHAEHARQRADKAERRAVRLAELAQRALLQQLTTEEQEELRALLASPQP